MKFVVTASHDKFHMLHIRRGTEAVEGDEETLMRLIAEKIHSHLQVLDLDAGDELHIEFTMVDQANQP